MEITVELIVGLVSVAGLQIGNIITNLQNNKANKVRFEAIKDRLDSQNGTVKSNAEDIKKLKDWNLHHVENCHGGRK